MSHSFFQAKPISDFFFLMSNSWPESVSRISHVFAKSFPLTNWRCFFFLKSFDPASIWIIISRIGTIFGSYTSCMWYLMSLREASLFPLWWMLVKSQIDFFKAKFRVSTGAGTLTNKECQKGVAACNCWQSLQEQIWGLIYHLKHTNYVYTIFPLFLT